MALRGPLYQISNLETWTDVIELFDDDSGDAVNLSSASDFIVSVRDAYDMSTYITASLTGGQIVRASDSLSANLTVPRSTMQTLQPKTYDIGLRVIWTTDTNEKQYILGQLAVLNGL